jgi:hypothetical protein
MPPEFLPVLAKGKHRNARRGACFMEFASLLAGERWSDHPKCTHAVLGALARSVNDVTSDDARPLLAPLVPEVIGTASDDPRVAPELAALTCRFALEHVHDRHARFLLAVALLSAERMIAEMEHGAGGHASDQIGVALSGKELATAESYVDRFRLSPRFYRRKGAQGVVENAVLSIAAERKPATDEALRELLSRAVALYHELVPDSGLGDRDLVNDGSWAAACTVVGSTPAGR